jgi:hypothetical protein
MQLLERRTRGTSSRWNDPDPLLTDDGQTMGVNRPAREVGAEATVRRRDVRNGDATAEIVPQAGDWAAQETGAPLSARNDCAIVIVHEVAVSRPGLRV